MAHEIIKMLTDDDGYKYYNTYWHLGNGSDSTGKSILCTGEYYGFGESAATFKSRLVDKGGITCPDCLASIKYFKSIKL